MYVQPTIPIGIIGVAQNGDAAPLAYEELVELYRAEKEAEWDTKWRRGDILQKEFCPFYGDDKGTLAQFAKDVEEDRTKLVSYLTTSRAYPDVIRITSLSWSHHRIAAQADKWDRKKGEFKTERRFDIMETAHDLGLSTGKVRQMVHDLLAEDFRNEVMENLDADPERQKLIADYLVDHQQLTSLRSYTTRGPWGTGKYRGNCTGWLIIDLLHHFRPASVLDPMEGSRTTRMVCKDMGIKYVGYDLKDGFDSVRQPIPGEFDFIFWHPPYHDMIVYGEDPRDLSACDSYEQFLTETKQALRKFFLNNLRVGGTLAVLMGDLRRDGEYYAIAADLCRNNPPTAMLVKNHFNTSSWRGKDYGDAPPIPISHEYILLFRKGDNVRDATRQGQ